MNVASLELCKELYELSGWGNTLKYYWGDDDSCFLGPHSVQENTPAYDLGYLLRKLPRQLVEGTTTPNWLNLNPPEATGERWAVGYRYPQDKVGFTTYADCAEDSAAKLAIELFKQGILTRVGE